MALKSFYTSLISTKKTPKEMFVDAPKPVSEADIPTADWMQTFQQLLVQELIRLQVDARVVRANTWHY